MNASFPRLKALLAASMFALAACLSGCKDKDLGQAPPVVIPPGGTGGPAAAEVAEMNAALQQQNYDQAVRQILAAQRKQMNDVEKEAISAATYQLLEAAGRDPQALEAYKNLSRIQYGR